MDGPISLFNDDPGMTSTFFMVRRMNFFMRNSENNAFSETIAASDVSVGGNIQLNDSTKPHEYSGQR